MRRTCCRTPCPHPVLARVTMMTSITSWSGTQRWSVLAPLCTFHTLQRLNTLGDFNPFQPVIQLVPDVL